MTVGSAEAVRVGRADAVTVGSADAVRVGLEEVLAAREARAARQARLVAGLPPGSQGCVVSLTLVVPGPVKTPPWTVPVFEAAVAAVEGACARFGWSASAEHLAADLPTGPEALWSVAAPAQDVKAAAATLEDAHLVGRLWDIDVLVAGPDGVRPLARTEVGGVARRCLLCGDASAACARSRRHDLSDLVAAARRMADDWQAGTAGCYARLAHACLLAEVWHTPKPGLVDRRNTGAHDDMDVPLFEASAAAVTPGLAECERLGREGGRAALPLAEALPALRRAGLAAEARMLDATGGVNTHRGAIYAFGLLCAAAGWLAGAGRPVTPSAVCELVAHVAPPMPASGATPTHGLSAYAAYGMTGARGAAASGYALVREQALPAYQQVLTATGEEDAALAQALLVLLARNEDTNLAARGGPSAVAAVRDRAEALLAAGGASAPEYATGMRAFDDDLIAAHLSPGGCADLLGVTRFLAHLGAGA